MFCLLSNHFRLFNNRIPVSVIRVPSTYKPIFLPRGKRFAAFDNSIIKYMSSEKFQEAQKKVNVTHSLRLLPEEQLKALMRRDGHYDERQIEALCEIASNTREQNKLKFLHLLASIGIALLGFVGSYLNYIKESPIETKKIGIVANDDFAEMAETVKQELQKIVDKSKEFEGSSKKNQLQPNQPSVTQIEEIKKLIEDIERFIKETQEKNVTQGKAADTKLEKIQREKVQLPKLLKPSVAQNEDHETKKKENDIVKLYTILPNDHFGDFVGILMEHAKVEIMRNHLDLKFEKKSANSK